MKKHGARKHAKLSPSGSYRWMTCPGSIALAEKLGITDKDDVKSPAAAEGEKAHELLEVCLTKGKSAPKCRTKAHDDSMVQHVDDVLEYVMPFMLRKNVRAYIETTVKIRWLGDGEDDEGTPDLAVHDYTRKELHVFDLKYGMNPVEVKSNSQMLIYTSAHLDILVDEGHDVMKWTVHHHICQPRAFHTDGPMRAISMSAAIVGQWLRANAPLVALARSPNAPRHADQKACHFCPCRAKCPTYAEAALAVAKQDFTEFLDGGIVADLTPDPKVMTPAEIGRTYRNIPLLLQWAQMFMTETFIQVAKGVEIPHLKIIEGKANRRWKDPVLVKKALDKMPTLDEDDYAPRRLLGLGDVGRLLPKAARDKFLDKHTIKPRGAPQVVPDTDPRPAINAKTAKLDFADFMEPTDEQEEA